MVNALINASPNFSKFRIFGQFPDQFFIPGIILPSRLLKLKLCSLGYRKRLEIFFIISFENIYRHKSFWGYYHFQQVRFYNWNLIDEIPGKTESLNSGLVYQ